MKVSKILGAVGLVASLSLFGVNAEAAPSRADVAAAIKAACSGGASASCLAAIKAQLALAASLGNTPAGIAIAQGLADAVAALGKANPDLGTQLASIVATTGAGFVQVAFGAVLDGTGTAATGVDPVPSGSAG